MVALLQYIGLLKQLFAHFLYRPDNNFLTPHNQALRFTNPAWLEVRHLEDVVWKLVGRGLEAPQGLLVAFIEWNRELVVLMIRRRFFCRES